MSRWRGSSRCRQAGAEPRWAALVSLCAFGALATTLLTESQSAAQIERNVGKDGVVEFSNKKQADRERALRKQRAAEGVSASATAGTLPPVMPSPSAGTDAGRYDEFVREAAELYHIPDALIRAVMKAESNFDPRAVSPANARGLMQMLPSVAERMLVTDIFDPRQNILGGTRYLRVLANTFNGNLQLTVAAYNAGAGAVARYGGIPPYAETEAYVARVLQYYQQFREPG